MIRWGVVGPGAIATGFAEAMQLADGGTITAVASRSAERAEAFGARFAIPTRYGDYDSLAADPDVDVDAFTVRPEPGDLYLGNALRLMRLSRRARRRSLTPSGSEEAGMSKRRCTALDTLLTFCPPAP